MEAVVNAIYCESEKTINKQVKKLQSIVADQKDEMEWLVVRILCLDTEKNQDLYQEKGVRPRGAILSYVSPK
jgi:hypothetical protein